MDQDRTAIRNAIISEYARSAFIAQIGAKKPSPMHEFVDSCICCFMLFFLIGLGYIITIFFWNKVDPVLALLAGFFGSLFLSIPVGSGLTAAAQQYFTNRKHQTNATVVRCPHCGNPMREK